MSTGNEAEKSTDGGSPAARGEQESSSAVTRPRSSPPARKQLPPFRVVLHNDDFNEMRYVVRTIVELTKLDSGRAIQIMMTAHKRGAAQVLVTHKERAELYKDQFAGKRLKVSIEPAE